MYQDLRPHGNIELNAGKLTMHIYGGPYFNRPPEMYGVNMAAEIDHPADVRVETKDFCVPSQDLMYTALSKAITASFKDKKSIYAGCMGGIGRTGLFMALMAKVFGEECPVEFVRANYKAHAVETIEQKTYVKTFPVEKLKWKIRYYLLLSRVGLLK